jgi:hypothetical protein
MTTALAIYLFITIGLGIGSWLKGYKNPDYVPPSNSAPKFIRVRIQLPLILYLMCGLPKSEKYPRGVITAWAFSMQFLGIGMLVFAALFTSLRQDSIGMSIDFVTIILLIYGITYWLTKKSAYKPHSGENQ